MHFTGVIFDVGGTLVWPGANFYEMADATSVANTLCTKGLLNVSESAAFAESIVTWRKTYSKEGEKLPARAGLSLLSLPGFLTALTAWSFQTRLAAKSRAVPTPPGHPATH